MFRPVLTFARCAFSGCGLGLGGELLVPSTDPNTQHATDAGVIGAREDVAAASSEGDVRTQHRASPPPKAIALPPDSGPSQTWVTPDASIDNSNDAAAGADGAWVTNLSDAPLLVKGADKSSGATTDAADETASSCERLLQCCNQLATTGAPVPVLAACFAQPWDGGNPGACDMVLTGLSGAGFCP